MRQVWGCAGLCEYRGCPWPSTTPLETEYKMPKTHLHFKCDTQGVRPPSVCHAGPSGSSEVLGLCSEGRVEVSPQSVRTGMRTLSWGQSPRCVGAGGWLPSSGWGERLRSGARQAGAGTLSASALEPNMWHALQECPLKSTPVFAVGRGDFPQTLTYGLCCCWRLRFLFFLDSQLHTILGELWSFV